MCKVTKTRAEWRSNANEKNKENIFSIILFPVWTSPSTMDGYKFVENQIKFNTRKLIITKNVYNNLKRW